MWLRLIKSRETRPSFSVELLKIFLTVTANRLHLFTQGKVVALTTILVCHFPHSAHPNANTCFIQTYLSVYTQRHAEPKILAFQVSIGRFWRILRALVTSLSLLFKGKPVSHVTKKHLCFLFKKLLSVNETSGAGAGIAGSASPKVVICRKSGQNPWKFGKNPWKSGQNL